MGIFTSKQHISENNALIGELTDNGDIAWNTADFEWCLAELAKGTLVDRGYKTVNGIYYRLFYLPPPKHFHEFEA